MPMEEYSLVAVDKGIARVFEISLPDKLSNHFYYDEDRLYSFSQRLKIELLNTILSKFGIEKIEEIYAWRKGVEIEFVPKKAETKFKIDVEAIVTDEQSRFYIEVKCMDKTKGEELEKLADLVVKITAKELEEQLKKIPEKECEEEEDKYCDW